MIRIPAVDDHALLRKGIAALVNGRRKCEQADRGPAFHR
jgi:hypothetical protein